MTERGLVQAECPTCGAVIAEASALACGVSEAEDQVFPQQEARSGTSSMIAFVLSRGGSLGAIQAGMLEALLERGIAPDALVGTSIGAANAAFLADEPTLPQAQALSGLWRSLKPRQIFLLGPIRTLKALRRDGSLFSTAPFRKLIERHSPYSRIDRSRSQTRLFLAGHPCDTCTHEEFRRSDNAPLRRWCVYVPT
jgi:predicted acylesterase/phospholipase RssA